MLKFKFLKFFIYFQIYFIFIYLLINLLSINFLLNCEENVDKNVIIAAEDSISGLSNLKEFYIPTKDHEENVSKNCFMECLGALDIFFKDGDGTQPFYYKKFLGKILIPYFEKYYDTVVDDERMSDEMAYFLAYFVNPELQILDFEYFRCLYKNFIIEYRSLYEKDWHPAGFERELDYFKNNIAIEEVSPLSVKKNKERIAQIGDSLKFFNIIGGGAGGNNISNEILISYTKYGQKFLKPLYYEFLSESQKIKNYNSQFFSNTEEFEGNYSYKLNYIIRHINKIQWFLEEYQSSILTFNNFFFITAYDDVLDFEKSLLFEKKTNIAAIYRELAIEKKLLQELIFIIYYPKVANGDIYLMKKLKDSQFYLNENKNLSEFIYIRLPIFDLRLERTFKRYIRFLIKAGVISDNDSNTLLYLENIKIFCEILSTRDCLLKPDRIMHLTRFLERFLTTTILKKEEKLINEYLSKDTVSKLKTKKNYYR